VTTVDDTLLDDLGRIAEVDVDGLLHAAAMSGAQLRATVEGAREAGLARYAGSTPRALVLLTRPGLSPAVAKLLMALLGRGCPVPIVVTDTAPPWLGPLDMVVAHTDDPGDTELAESVDRACRFGAGVVLTAPEDGPVAAAAAGRAVLITPRVHVPPGLAFTRALAGGLITATTLNLLRTDLDLVADELDREAERDHMQHETFVNPAKSLALRLAERTPLLWGLDDVAVAVGVVAAQAIATHAALVCDVAAYPQAASRTALHRGATRASAGADIFADPDDLDPAQSSPLRVFLLAVRATASDPARRLAADTFPAADLLAPAEEITADETTCAAVLALRFQLAALYLGLAAGTTGGSPFYAPARPREH
jgi:Bacterial phospho-glucose isomerase C-terminal SIS domain